MTNVYPHSAISSWSGYVYQGKVALYHSLKLLAENTYPNGFNLQLDSIDDFAIYVGGTLVSAHQVKGRASTSRPSYEEALAQSAIITIEKTANIKRYFHVSAKLDDFKDYVDATPITVEFYEYGDRRFCPLNEIEGLTKIFFQKIYCAHGLSATDSIFEICYCKLSEHLTRRVIDMHHQNQTQSVPINQVAYQNFISSEDIENIIISVIERDSLEISLLKFRKNLFATLELHVINNEHLYTSEQYDRANSLFAHVYELNSIDMESFCQIIQPVLDVADLRNDDIEQYIDLICDFLRDPILTGIPHYSDVEHNLYVPTAIRLANEKQVNSFKAKLIGEVSRKNKLSKLLFEYKNLIAETCMSTQVNQSIVSPGLDKEYETIDANYDRKITKPLMVNVISSEDAKRKLM